jgi:site-specific DNA-cytosine methylase
MKVISLFDGMSGGQLALKKADLNVSQYHACEIDKYAIKVTQANFPSTIQHGDVTKFNPVAIPLRKRYINKPDLLIAGAPCQDFSVAGRQLGHAGSRGKLFYEVIRIIDQCKPKYFFIENVKMRKESEKIFTDLLGVEPIEINSALVSAQNRKRLYWTNIPNVTQPTDQNILLKDVLENGYVDRDKSHCIDANYWKGGNLKSYFEKHRRQLVFSNHLPKHYRNLSPLECERLQGVPDNYTNYVSNTQRYKMLGNGFQVDTVAHILSFI